MAIAGRTHIGPFRLVRQIRAGHSCQIWLGLRGISNERVALKILKEEYRKDRREIGQLKHELQVSRDLNHPNIIQAIEFNITERIPFLALEFFGIKNLKQAIYERAINLDTAIHSIFEGGGQAIGHLHERGWLHRDIKPDNFMFGDDASVKLIDFSLACRIKKGIARLLGGRTRVQGTRSYMSPEQIRGELLDTRSDVYSFGCTIYEILNGRPPYTAESANELLNKHLKASVPSLVVARDDITEEFAELLSRMMAKRPVERPSSIADVLDNYRRIKVFTTEPKPRTI